MVGSPPRRMPEMVRSPRRRPPETVRSPLRQASQAVGTPRRQASQMVRSPHRHQKRWTRRKRLREKTESPRKLPQVSYIGARRTSSGPFLSQLSREVWRHCLWERARQVTVLKRSIAREKQKPRGVLSGCFQGKWNGLEGLSTRRYGNAACRVGGEGLGGMSLLGRGDSTQQAPWGLSSQLSLCFWFLCGASLQFL